MRHLFLGLLFLPFSLLAQVSMEEFLWSAWEAPELRTLMQQKAFLETSDYKLSPIREVEFRTETNQLDPQRQDFALRLSPSNPWEVKRNNDYFQAYQEVIDLDQGRKLKALLTRHYTVIVGWSYLQEQKQLKQEELQLTQSLIRVLESQRLSSFFDSDDYADLKIDLVEMQSELEELDFEEEILRKEIEALFPPAQSQQIAWSMASLVSVEDIEQWIRQHQASAENGEIAYRQKLVELAKAEWALEKSNLNIGYIQAQYQQYRLEQERSPWSIGLGVRLPLFNPNRGKMAEKKLDILESQGELTRAETEQEAGLSLAKAKVTVLTQRYHALQEQLESLDIEGLGQDLTAIRDSNPQVGLRLRRSLVKSKNATARLKRDIYQAYIDYLGQAELLQKLPMVNYLQKGSVGR